MLADAHQHEARHQEALAPDPVAEMAEHDAADRPRHEAQRIGEEGLQQAGERDRLAGKNSLPNTSAAAVP